MNSSQRNAALVFLAAIALVTIPEFANGKVTFIVAVLLIPAIFIVVFYRNRQPGRSFVSKLSTKLAASCLITSIAYFAITAFIDIQCRRLHLFPQAVAAMQSSPEAAHLLGSPIRVSWPVKAHGNLSNDSGETQLTIPVSGTLGTARLVADGISVNGNWTITSLQLVQNSSVTNLQPTPTAR